MQKHMRGQGARVVHKYAVDTLGAPFKVVVVDCVSLHVDAETGQETVQIPDLVGLINAVVRTRACHPRKLSGPDIKFIRKSLGMRSKPLAEFLDMSPEHFSRCESGQKVMSTSNERIFRLMACVSSFLPNPSAIFRESALEEAEQKSSPEKKKRAGDFVRSFLSIKIQSVYDAEKPLCFEFSRNTHDKRNRAGADDDEWNSEPLLSRCA